MPRNWPLGLLHWRRFWLLLEPRDIWVGVYVASKAVYVCLVPCVVAKWERRVRSEQAATGDLCGCRCKNPKGKCGCCDESLSDWYASMDGGPADAA